MCSVDTYRKVEPKKKKKVSDTCACCVEYINKNCPGSTTMYYPNECDYWQPEGEDNNHYPDFNETDDVIRHELELEYENNEDNDFPF
jgi:hypothetical protein